MTTLTCPDCRGDGGRFVAAPEGHAGSVWATCALCAGTGFVTVRP